jgi:Tfp pilus assembly protein PilF
VPERPRSHQLEEESRRAFGQAIPSSWVHRPIQPDYGIDFEVELFKDNGSATGTKFYVQLKATEKKRLELALAIPLRKDTASYFQSLPVPVLIVLFHAPTNQLFARWFHEYDSFHSRRGAKHFTFRLSKDNLWLASTPKTLQADLEFFAKIGGLGGERPIRFYIEATANRLHGYAAGLLIAKIRELAPSHLVQIVSQGRPRSAHCALILSPRRIQISLGGYRTLSLHNYGKKFTKFEVLEEYPRDVLIGLALVLARSGRPDVAVPILEKHAGKAKCTQDLGISGLVGKCLAHVRNVQAALTIAEEMYHDERKWNAAAIMFGSVILSAAPLSQAEDREVRAFWERRIVQFTQARSAEAEATAHYNFGNYLRSVGVREFRAAIRHYREAGKLDPDYRGRSYFWMELGGTLFLAGKYKIAARFYEKAFELGGHVSSQLADALMYAGRYIDARQIFQAELTRRDPRQSALSCETRLKARALDVICNTVSAQQVRRSRTAESIARRAAELVGAQRESLAREALSCDALCAQAWIELARAMRDSERSEDYFEMLLVAFVLAPEHPSLWAIVLGSGLNVPVAKPYLEDIFELAYRRQGEGLIFSFAEMAREGLRPDMAQQVINLLTSISGELQASPDSPVIRILGTGNEVKEIRLHRSQGDPGESQGGSK